MVVCASMAAKKKNISENWRRISFFSCVFIDGKFKFSNVSTVERGKGNQIV